jgi:RNA polymerase sigma factor (sigma-70 family)
VEVTSVAVIREALDSRALEESDFVRGIEFHRRHLRRFIAARVPSHLVDDVLQETLLGAYCSEERRDRDRPWLPWLYTIAHRMCVQTQHRERKRQLALANLPAPTLACDPAEILETAQLARAFDIAWWSLTPRHRRLLYRLFSEGLRYEELAAEEQRTRDVLKMAVCRARARFRESYRDATQGMAVAIPGVCIRARRWTMRLLRDRCTPLEALGAGLASFGVAVALVTVGAMSTEARSTTVKTKAVSPSGSPPTTSATTPSATFLPLTTATTSSAGTPTSGVTTQPQLSSSPESTSLPVRSTTRLDVDPHRASADVTITIHDPTGQSDGGLRATIIECTERSMVSRTACAVARSTPYAED